MSDFEYLRSTSLGQYLPLKSFLHSRDPRAKLMGFAFLILAITFANRPAGMGFALAAVGLLALMSQVPLRYALHGLLPPLPFLLFLAILQIFIAPQNRAAAPLAEIVGLPIYAAGIQAALMLITKFCLLIVLFTLGSASISTLEMTHGLDLLLKPLNRLGVRTDAAAMTLQITLRFVPFLAISAERIAKSQASRGAEWGSGKMNLVARVRRMLPLLIPLFNNSLRQTETLAEAMLSRGYASGHLRHGMVEYHFGWQDAFLLSVCCLLAYLILFPIT